MKWTWHSDYTVMMPYIDIADSIKVNAMSSFDLFSESYRYEKMYTIIIFSHKITHYPITIRLK